MSLAYDTHGSGTPIVLLHGLTFDRTSWRPIVERLGDDFHRVAVDLPAHGDSPGPPAYVDVVAGQVHELVEQLGIESPIVVGHSISGGVVMTYAATYPVRGAISIDSAFDLRPMIRMMRQVGQAPSFEQAFEPFQRSMRIDLVPGGVPQQIREDVVLGYWAELLHADPEMFQRRIETVGRRITAPALALFGEALAPEQRDYIGAVAPTVEVEEWPGRGHMLHLVEPDRFTARLCSFAASLERSPASTGSALRH
jgi:pimeloyl-ACP methyl ester carboxylesterase